MRPSAGAGELAQLIADSHDPNETRPAPRVRREHITIAPPAGEHRRTLTARLSPRRRRWTAAGLGATLAVCIAVWMFRGQPPRSPQSSPTMIAEDPTHVPRSPSTRLAPPNPTGMQRMTEDTSAAPPTHATDQPGHTRRPAASKTQSSGQGARLHSLAELADAVSQ